MENTIFTIFHRTGVANTSFEAKFVPFVCYGAAAEAVEQTDSSHRSARKLTLWLTGNVILLDPDGQRCDPQAAGIAPGDRIMVGEHTSLHKAESYGIHTVVPLIRGSRGNCGLRIVAG